jgi:hypothetical protein
VLLLDPHQAIVNMRARNPNSIREEWWSAFAARCNAIGITLPPANSPDGPDRGDSDAVINTP